MFFTDSNRLKRCLRLAGNTPISPQNSSVSQQDSYHPLLKIGLIYLRHWVGSEKAQFYAGTVSI